MSASKSSRKPLASHNAENREDGRITEAPGGPRTRQKARRQPVLELADKPEEQGPGDQFASEESPVLGLVDGAGSVCISADSSHPDGNPPPGLLTEIRRAQQDIRAEQDLTDLRAEIQAFQEDIQQESESQTTSSSPTDAGPPDSPNRYQDTPSGRQLHGGPFGGRQAGEEVAMDSPLPRAPQNTPAVGHLVALKDVLLRSGSSCADSEDGGGTDSEAEAGQRDACGGGDERAGEGAAAAADIRARLMALRLSQEVHASELDTDGSDTAEKLAALRTRLVPDDSPEAVDIAEIEASEGEAPAGFVPRGATVPSFMELKLKRLQEAEWSGDQEARVHLSQLERIKQEAAAARRDGLGSAEKALTRKLVQGAVSNAVQSDGLSLAESLIPHRSRLEREKDAAAAAASAAAETGATTPQPGRQPAHAARQGLAEGLRRHKPRLALEKEAASAAWPAASLPSYMRPTAASRHAASQPGGLSDALLVHQSRLERERAAAAATREAAWNSNPRVVGSVTERPSKSAAWGELSDMKVHKSRLERERESARQRFDSAAAPSRPTRGLSRSGEGSLSDLKPHKSRLEREKEAWLKAAAKHAR